MEIQQGSGGRFLTGRTALRPRASRMGQKQRGQPLDQRLGVQVAPQQVQGVVLDGVEGDRPIDRLGMTGFFRIELSLCRFGQECFQAGQVHGCMKVLPDGFGPIVFGIAIAINFGI